jgi:hypothetical protein
VKAAREVWFEGQLDLDPGRLVFLDETWTSTNMARTRGRSPRSDRPPRRTLQLRGFGRRFDAARGSGVIGPVFWQADDSGERARGPIPRLPQAATGLASIQRKRLRL